MILLINTLIPLMGLVLAVYFIFEVYPRFVVNRFRQRLLIRRDELFLRAAHGHIPFDSQAYTLLRARVNILVRQADHISLMNVIAYQLLLPASAKEWQNKIGKEELRSAFSALPREQRELAELNDKLISFELGQHLVFNSYLLIFCAVPIMVIAKLFQAAWEKLFATAFAQQFISSAYNTAQAAEIGDSCVAA